MGIDIAIPVLGRPGQEQKVLESIHANSRTPYRVLFLCSQGDSPQIAACAQTGAGMLIVPWPAGPGDFARKINYAFAKLADEFLFTAADDLRFHPGWDEKALRVAEDTGAGVIGTNDMGNPLVRRGRHSTHSLVRRSYIEEQGGTFDGSGAVLCEKYDHQWCDNELVQTAMLRHQWAFAHEALVEHLHPNWRKSDMDATYEKAMRATRADIALFQKRMRRARATISYARMKRR